MNKLKKGLGRGLSSLIGETKSTNKINTVEISKIVKNKFQPRKIFDENKLNELTNSVKEEVYFNPLLSENIIKIVINLKL